MTKLKGFHYAAAAACGLLTAAAFPGIDQLFFAWISFIPFFFLMTGQTPGRAFLLGGTAGLFFTGWLFPWVPAVFRPDGGLSAFPGLLVSLLPFIVLGLTWALFGLGFSFIFLRRPLAAFIAAPFLWTGLEYLASRVLAGFPGGCLGLSQAKDLLFIQTAGLAGVYGVSFMLILFQAMFAGSIKTTRRLPFAAGMIALVLVHLFGFLSLKKPAAGTDSFPAAVIQGAVPSGVDWKAAPQDRAFSLFIEHLALARRAVDDGAKLIVWPLPPIPLCFTCEEEQPLASSARLQGFARETGAALVAETNDSILCLSPDGSFNRYGKTRPAALPGPAPETSGLGVAKQSPGSTGGAALRTGTVVCDITGQPFGAPVGREIGIPQSVRRFIRSGASYLVPIAGGRQSGRPSALRRQFSQAVFRAVENRRFILQAAATGVSGIVDPWGRVTEKIEIGTEGFASGMITPNRRLTFYARHGDVFSILCLTMSAFFLILSLFKRRP